MFDRLPTAAKWTQGYVTCFVDNGWNTRVNLTTEYSFVVPTIETGVPFQFVREP